MWLNDQKFIYKALSRNTIQRAVHHKKKKKDWRQHNNDTENFLLKDKIINTKLKEKSDYHFKY